MSVSDVSSSSGVGTTDTSMSTADQGQGTTDSTASNTAGGQSALVETAVVEVQQNDNQMQDVQSQIDTAISGGMSESEADQVASQIVAQNIENQKEEMEQEQQETGEYADSSALIAYMGYVPGFNAYSQVTLDDASNWYEPKAIYGNVSIPDNNSAFVGLYGQSLTGMKGLMDMQPQL
jgi:hypothetical protein